MRREGLVLWEISARLRVSVSAVHKTLNIHEYGEYRLQILDDNDEHYSTSSWKAYYPSYEASFLVRLQVLLVILGEKTDSELQNDRRVSKKIGHFFLFTL